MKGGRIWIWLVLALLVCGPIGHSARAIIQPGGGIEWTAGVPVWLYRCQVSLVTIAIGATWWGTSALVSGTYVIFNNMSQTQGGPALSFGLGCDPNEPAINSTLVKVTPQGVLLAMEGTPLNGSLYGIFYYGSLGIPEETTFSFQTPIEKDGYVTDYPVFVSGLNSPAVYLNSTGGYIEWRLPATAVPQYIYFTNSPTHTTVTETFPIQVQSQDPLAWFNDSWPVKTIDSIFGSVSTFVLLLIVGFFVIRERRVRQALRKLKGG